MNTQTITLTPPIDGVQYGISDEPINLNDWYVDDTNAIRQSIISQSDSDYWLRRTDYKKVILSTNPKDLRFPFLVMPSKEQEVENITQEQAREMWQFCHKQTVDILRGGNDKRLSFEDYIQSLQPTVKAVRVEMEEIRSPEFGNCQHFKEVGCIKDICTCYTFKIKVETLSEYPQGLVKALEVIY